MAAVLRRDRTPRSGRRPALGQVTGRITGRNDLVPELARTMLTRHAADWIERLEARGVPCGPINDYAQVFEDPQVKFRELRVDLPRADGASVATIASPLRLCGTPPVYQSAPPTLGSATEDILRRLLGRDTEQIAALRAKRLI